MKKQLHEGDQSPHLFTNVEFGLCGFWVCAHASCTCSFQGKEEQVAQGQV